MESGDVDSIKRKKLKQNEQGVVGGDMISSLPEPILHHILSFLDMKHVLQTSILSKKWRYVWMSLPFLKFDCQLFHSERTASWNDPVALKRERKTQYLEGERFEHFVDEVLLLRDTSDINSFHLYSIHSESSCRINNRLYSWILTAVRRNVQQLYLGLSINWCTGLPHCLFTCTSLRVLELDSWWDFDLSLPDSMSLPSLETLSLEYFRIDDIIASRIFSSCPVLESLHINECIFPNDVEFYAPRLKHLVISIVDCCDDHHLKTMKLYAPNLISLNFRSSTFKAYFLQNLSALVKAEIDSDLYWVDDESGSPSDNETREENPEPAKRVAEFLRAFHNVKDLQLALSFLKTVSGALHLLEGTSIQLGNLTCLKMNVKLSRDINAITYLLKVSPNIESLFLDLKGCPKCPYWDEVRVNSASTEDYQEVGVLLQCVLDHLKVVDVRGVEERLNELMLLEILLKNAMVLEKVILHTSKEQSPHGKYRLLKFTEKLLTLPRASSSLAILLL